ncbi:MAG: hypothetical protein HQK79_19680 [Desulfobacterales bacterium]|nr:hypothetical protein [Desulfobacterales bacterium]MBF0398036.1 hypothetical protein [Desulfobacterales bacterium]
MIKKKAKYKSNFKKNNIADIACWVMILIILLLDILIPLGAAITLAYILVVYVSLSSPKEKFPIFIAVFCSILTIFIFFYQPLPPEVWKVIFNRVLSIFAIILTAILGLQRKIMEQSREKAFLEREKALDELNYALKERNFALEERNDAIEELRILNGTLPICASCKKIRDKKNHWHQIESYIKNNSEADFTHTICPECAKKLYPEYSFKK